MRTLLWLVVLAIPLHAAPGRFGGALDAREGPLLVKGDPRYVTPPLTVECWAKVHSKATFNLLVASEPKSSGTHWELYTYAGSGVLSAYLPGYAPGELKSDVDLADDRWHHVALQYEATRVRLLVDGRQVLDQPITRKPEMPSVAGPLAFGTALAPGQELGCDGLVDDVRISNGVRPIVLPTGPLSVEAETVGLWHLDAADKDGAFADSSPFGNPAKPDLDSRVSLDELDRAAFRPGPSRMAIPLTARSESEEG